MEDLFLLRSPEVLSKDQEVSDSLGLGEVFRLQVFSDGLPVLLELQNMAAGSHPLRNFEHPHVQDMLSPEINFPLYLTSKRSI